MQCAYCGRESQAIRPSKRYCNNVCRQADYRRRHQGERENVTELKMQLAQARQELEQARQRIQELEQALKTRQSSRNVTVARVELGKFADLHGIARGHARLGFYEYRHTHKLQPYELDDTYLLNAQEQRVFWERNHGYGHTWRECGACPHEVMESTTIVRKRPDFHSSAIMKGLPSGCILAHDFAKIHGVPWGTFRDHMVVGIGKGLPPESKDKVACCERPKAGRANETERYLTQEQQRAALDYWQRHGVKFNLYNDEK